MKPLDFYDLGVQLAAAAETETQYRTAISRIYYGLHHESCCRYFRTMPAGAPLPRRRRHTELADRFIGMGDYGPIRIGRLLSNLRMMRAEADYQLDLPLRYRNRRHSPEQLPRRCLFVAEELLRVLDDFSPGAAADGCRCLAL